MRRMSQKRRAYLAAITPDRNAWGWEQPRCHNCGVRDPWPGLQTHEIERKAQAPLNWAHRCNYLRLCNECHFIGFNSNTTHAEQLAVKQVADPEHYDLTEFLKIKPRAALYVTQAEVDGWIHIHQTVEF